MRIARFNFEDLGGVVWLAFLRSLEIAGGAVKERGEQDGM